MRAMDVAHAALREAGREDLTSFVRDSAELNTVTGEEPDGALGFSWAVWELPVETRALVHRAGMLGSAAAGDEELAVCTACFVAGNQYWVGEDAPPWATPCGGARPAESAVRATSCRGSVQAFDHHDPLGDGV